MSELYVNVRNSQLIRSYSVIPSGTPRTVPQGTSTSTRTRSTDGSAAHYQRPSLAFRSKNQHPSSIIKTRSNTMNSITTTISAGGPRLPPLPRLSTSSRNSNDSIKNPNSPLSASRFGPPPESLMKGMESSTSNSIFHGMVLIMIMTTSLASFIGALMYDFCEDHTIKCNHGIHIFYTVTSILSCTFCFLVYFLHLVGQCDYITWSAKRKVSLEILFTMIIFIMVITCIITATHHSVSKFAPTETKNKVITVISIVSLAVSAFCYVIRILSLGLEARVLQSKPPDTMVEDTVGPLSNSMIDRKMSIKSCTSSSTNFATIAHPAPYSVSGYNPKASFTRHRHDVIREVSNTNPHSMDTFPRNHGNLTLFEDDEVFLDV